MSELCYIEWRAHIVYITSSRRTVRLGLLQGLYERFPIRNLTGIVHLHRRDSTGMGTSSIIVLPPWSETNRYIMDRYILEHCLKDRYVHFKTEVVIKVINYSLLNIR